MANPIRDERDLFQRAIGCFSFSMLAHAGILIAAFLVPALPQISEMTASTRPAETFIDLSATPAAQGDVSQASASQMTEVAVVEKESPKQTLMASANDKSAVAVAPVPQEKTPTELPKKAVPKELPPKVVKSQPVAAPAPKLARTLPAKKVSHTIAANDGDVAIQAALDSSRKSRQDETPANDEKIEPVATVETKPDSLQRKLEKEMAAEPTVMSDQEAVENQPSPPQTVAVLEKKPSKKEIFNEVQAEDLSFDDTKPISNKPEASAAPMTGSANTTSRASQIPSATQVASSGNGSAPSAGTMGIPTGIRDGDDLAELAGNTKPEYPFTDQKAGHQGTTVFLARVTPDGHIEDIRLEKSSQSKSMDASAAKAFKTYRYKAGQQGWIRKSFNFKLTGEAKEIQIRYGR